MNPVNNIFFSVLTALEGQEAAKKFFNLKTAYDKISDTEKKDIQNYIDSSITTALLSLAIEIEEILENEEIEDASTVIREVIERKTASILEQIKHKFHNAWLFI